MPNRRTTPQLNSSTLRMRRLRDRAAGREPRGYAGITHRAALDIRRQMFEDCGQQYDGYGPGVTAAILKAMHLLVSARGEVFPVHTLMDWSGTYRRPEHPVCFLNRLMSDAIGRPVELADPDPLAGA